MAEPKKEPEVVAPPHPPIKKISGLMQGVNAPPGPILKFLEDLIDYLTQVYQHNYLVWKRTGGYNSGIPDTKGLKVSIKELNTLVGIDVSTTVQAQINKKLDILDVKGMAFQEPDAVAITGGSINNTSSNNLTINSSTITNSTSTNAIIQDSTATLKLGSSGSIVNTGGTAFSSIDEKGNIGVGEDNLISYTLPANSLAENANYLELHGWGIFAANGNNKRIRLYFGSTLIYDTTAIAANDGSWWIEARIIRVNSNSHQAIVKIVSDNALVSPESTFTSCTELSTNPVDIFFTGEATSDDDVIQKSMIVKWFK